MAEFNQYNLYSYMVGDFKSATDGKILVDLKKLDSLNDNSINSEGDDFNLKFTE